MVRLTLLIIVITFFNRLESEIGLARKALDWYKSYFTERTTSVLINNNFFEFTGYREWAPTRLNYCWTEVLYDLYHLDRKDNQATESFISHLHG